MHRRLSQRSSGRFGGSTIVHPAVNMNGAEVRSRVLDGAMTSVPLYSIHAANAIFALCGFNVDLDSIEWRELLSDSPVPEVYARWLPSPFS